MQAISVHSDEIPPQPQANIAPVWHTAGVLLLLGAISALSLRMSLMDPAAQGKHRALGYLITMASEWLIVGFIAFKAPLQTLTGKFALTWKSVLRDLGIAIAYLLVAQVVLGTISAVLSRFLPSHANAVLKNMVPHTAVEIGLYLLLSLTAGICEELMFRGYLQRQFVAWTGNAAAAIILQGIVFGLAHGYQGPSMVIVISVFGCMFGWLAWWRKSLRPGMMAHFIQDGVGGIVLARFLPK